MEPIFEAVLANDPSRIAAAEAGTPGAAAQRMDEDLLVTELPHMLYRGDTPLHLAAAGLRYDAARALLAAGSPVDAVNRRGATALHYACDARPLAPTWDPAAQRRVIELLVSAGATVDQPDRGGVTPPRARRSATHWPPGNPEPKRRHAIPGSDLRSGTDQVLMMGNAGSTRDMSSGSLVITACRRSLAQSATWTSITSSWPLRAQSNPTLRATFGVMMAMSISRDFSNRARRT